MSHLNNRTNVIYEILQGERVVAQMDQSGRSKLLQPQFMPYDLYLEECEDDIDYLVGNIDRHPENWGVLVDNQTNHPVSLYPLMDFNQSFLEYHNLNGANCQTVLPRHLTQKEAAIEAVKNIGLLQIKEVPEDWFGDKKEWASVFRQRLELLKQV